MVQISDRHAACGHPIQKFDFGAFANPRRKQRRGFRQHRPGGKETKSLIKLQSLPDTGMMRIVPVKQREQGTAIDDA